MAPKKGKHLINTLDPLVLAHSEMPQTKSSNALSCATSGMHKKSAPFSLTLAIKKSTFKHAKRVASRKEALKLLRLKPKIEKRMSNREIAVITSVPRTVVNQLSKALKEGNDDQLEELVSANCKAGRKTVLTEEEEKMVVQKLLFGASRGSAVGYDGLRYMIGRVAADGRDGYKNGVSSDDALRSFHARHRELTFRSQESKEAAKISAECESHVRPFFEILANIGKENPGLLENPNRIWNLHKTKVDYVFGKKEKVFASASSHHGGFKSCSTTYSSQKHITALVAVSASGHKCPPFFIVEGKRINERWFDPIRGQLTNGVASGVCARYTVLGWFPAKTSVVKVSDNGSMEIDLLEAAIKHISKFIETVVGSEKVILTLDGHASRNGVGWIEKCRRKNIEAVIAPANTSHFLQPCDQAVNKGYKNNGRKLRDAFYSCGKFDTRKVNFNLACGVYSFDCITHADITDSLDKCGLYPFQIDFASRFRKAADTVRDVAVSQKMVVHSAAIASRLPSVIQRESDKRTLEELKSIFASGDGPSTIIQRLSIVLKNAETVNNILLFDVCDEAAAAFSRRTQQVKNQRPEPFVACVVDLVVGCY